MKMTRVGKRFVVIGAAAPAAGKIAPRQRSRPRATPQRIIVMTNGERGGRGRKR
jgi:hypothetical protein